MNIIRGSLTTFFFSVGARSADHSVVGKLKKSRYTKPFSKKHKFFRLRRAFTENVKEVYTEKMKVAHKRFFKKHVFFLAVQ